MAHTKKTWIPREGVNLNKFNKISETTSSVILQNAPDSISVAGTPFSAAWMNDLETTAATLSNLNVITDIDDIPALGTGVYTATGATGAPTADTIVYEYKGEATAGILTAKPVSANFGQVWERRRSGSAWVTGWMLKSGWGTMALDTEYLTDYDTSGIPLYAQKQEFTSPGGGSGSSKGISGISETIKFGYMSSISTTWISVIDGEWTTAVAGLRLSGTVSNGTLTIYNYTGFTYYHRLQILYTKS